MELLNLAVSSLWCGRPREFDIMRMVSSTDKFNSELHGEVASGPSDDGRGRVQALSGRQEGVIQRGDAL